MTQHRLLSIGKLLSLLVITLQIAGFCSASRLESEKVYLNLYSENICFRRLNKTHQTGCQSSASGNVGTVHIFNDTVDKEKDFHFVLSSGPNAPYVPCIPLNLFTNDNLVRLIQTDRIAGLVVFNRSRPLTSGFSPDAACPNTAHELYADSATYAACRAQTWNPIGAATGLLNLDIPFPIFFIGDEQNMTRIVDCYNEFNARVASGYQDAVDEPKCSIQLQARMNAAKDSPTCISRSTRDLNSLSGSIKFCDPLGSFNIFAPLLEYNNRTAAAPVENGSVTILSARLDAFSMFDALSHGADSALTGLIAFFSVVDTLNKAKPALSNTTSQKSNVLFSLFDGEAFDYIGSGRTAFDLAQPDGLAHFSMYKSREAYNKPALRKSHIGAMLELSQLALYANRKSYFLHSDPLSAQNSSSTKAGIEQIMQILVSNSAGAKLVELKKAAENLPLPPSSAQSFLSRDFQIPAVVIANHEGEFENRFYNSFLDDAQNVGYVGENKQKLVDYLSELSTIVARSLFELIAASPAPATVKADSDLVSKLAECFFVNVNCTYLNYIRGSNSRLPIKQMSSYPLYISNTFPGMAPYHLEYISTLERLLAFLTGDPQKQVNTPKDCIGLRTETEYASFEWYGSFEKTANDSDGMCVRTTRFTTEALSPVFINSLEPNWDLGFSTWTESVWSAPKARLFLAPSLHLQYSILATGLAILFFSFAIVLFVNRKADILFLELRLGNVAVSGL